jgi:hypothetical protein
VVRLFYFDEDHMAQDAKNAESAPANGGRTLTQRIARLSTQLQNPAINAPIFVRFQMTDRYLTIPVMAVALNGNTVEVKAADGLTHSINIESLIDVVAFRDVSGAPVFLHDFDAENNYMPDPVENQAELLRDQNEVLEEFFAKRAAERTKSMNLSSLNNVVDGSALQRPLRSLPQTGLLSIYSECCRACIPAGAPSGQGGE